MNWSKHSNLRNLILKTMLVIAAGRCFFCVFLSFVAWRCCGIAQDMTAILYNYMITSVSTTADHCTLLKLRVHPILGSIEAVCVCCEIFSCNYSCFADLAFCQHLSFFRLSHLSKTKNINKKPLSSCCINRTVHRILKGRTAHITGILLIIHLSAIIQYHDHCSDYA